jgi:hypothetical protein
MRVVGDNESPKPDLIVTRENREQKMQEKGDKRKGR